MARSCCSGEKSNVSLYCCSVATGFTLLLIPSKCRKLNGALTIRARTSKVHRTVSRGLFSPNQIRIWLRFKRVFQLHLSGVLFLARSFHLWGACWSLCWGGSFPGSPLPAQGCANPPQPIFHSDTARAASEQAGTDAIQTPHKPGGDREGRRMKRLTRCWEIQELGARGRSVGVQQGESGMNRKPDPHARM